MANITSAVAFACVPNRKLLAIYDMPVRRELLRRSCPCDSRGGVANYVTCNNSVPILDTLHKTLWSRDEFWWYYKPK